MRPLPDEIRVRIAELGAEHGVSYATMSRALRRDDDRYIDRHVREQRPNALDLEDRARLARFFGIPARQLDAEHAPSEQSRIRPTGVTQRASGARAAIGR